MENTNRECSVDAVNQDECLEAFNNDIKHEYSSEDSNNFMEIGGTSSAIRNEEIELKFEETVYERSMWTTEKTLDLIEHLRRVRSLWDVSCKDYRNKTKKNNEMHMIAKRFGTNAHEISKKIKSLKTQFTREHKKVTEKTRSGALLPETVTWFGYEHLKFLMQNHSTKGIRNVVQVKADIGSSTSDSEESASEKETGSTQRTDPEDNRLPGMRKSVRNKQGNNYALPTSKNERSSRHTFAVPCHDSPRNVKRKNNASEVDESFKFTKDSQGRASGRDDCSIYGEYVASRLRNANQSYRATAIARHEIDNVLFKLEMGLFSDAASNFTRNSASTRSSSVCQLDSPVASPTGSLTHPSSTTRSPSPNLFTR